MSLIYPFWFKQRQCKAEPVEGDRMLEVSGPNLGKAYLYVRQENDRWAGGVRLTPEGPDLAASEPDFTEPAKAWDAAFELYRRYVIT